MTAVMDFSREAGEAIFWISYEGQKQTLKKKFPGKNFLFVYQFRSTAVSF